MSLVVYSGLPGSGKSYHCVSDMVLNKTKPVITNMIVKNLDNVAMLPLEEITPRLLEGFSAYYFRTHEFKENQIILILDESQLLFNCRTWADKERFPWLEFLSQHRKYGYQVILVSQNIELLDKSFRTLCEFDIRHTSSGSVSILTRVLHKLGIKYTCANTYYFESEQLLCRNIYKIKKRIYEHYDTRQDITAPEFTEIDISPITNQLELFLTGAEGTTLGAHAAHVKESSNDF